MLENFEKIFAPVLTGHENLNNKEIQVRCPFHKDDTPSMCINTETGMWICFGCNEKGNAITFYEKTRGVDYKTAIRDLNIDNERKIIIKSPPEKRKEDKKTVDYSKYCNKVFDDIYSTSERYHFYTDKLFELRGIKPETAVNCLIGYDPNQGWVFPIYRYPDLKCVGYEIRHKLFKKFFGKTKCQKAVHTPACLAVVWNGWTKNKAIICEGFIDSYFMAQYMLEQNKDYWILTPSNGVHSLPKLVEQLKDFKEVVFVLDNDKAGQETSAIIDSLGYKNFTFFKKLKENQDFEEWYKERSKNE